MARAWQAARARLLALWAIGALVYLFVPVLVVIAFSFNDNRGRFNFTWQGFTLRHWEHPLAVQDLGGAMAHSLEIAVLAVVGSLVLGTMLALALVRHRFVGRGPLNLLIILPLATPDVVMGAALLGLFLTLNVATGFWTIVIAHVMFDIAFVTVTVAARLQGMDRHIEEAAADLGADGWTTFRLVTLPLIAPGLAAAGLLAFVLSIDDFIVTNFNAGGTLTFPLFIFGAARQGVPPQVNVLATILLLAAVALMLANLALERRRAARLGQSWAAPEVARA